MAVNGISTGALNEGKITESNASELVRIQARISRIRTDRLRFFRNAKSFFPFLVKKKSNQI